LSRVGLETGNSAGRGQADAFTVAEQVALRLADEAILRMARESSQRQTQFPTVGWRSHSMAAGYPGVALLFGVLDRSRSGAGWDRLAHRQLSLAVASLPAHPSPSLFSGLAGIGFAAATMADSGDRYAGLLRQVDAVLVPLVQPRLARLSDCVGCGVGDFDVISGLSGVGAYLLQRLSNSAAVALLEEVLRCLSDLLRDDREPRRWHTPPELSGEALSERHPHGSHNCGLAHGIPGPLALLSIAALEGVLVPHQTEAIETAADWLTRHRTISLWGPDWPNGIALAPETAETEFTGATAHRAAWCYGAPGVARALDLAGRAIGNDAHRRLAGETMLGVFNRPLDARGITSPTFCHGAAGLLQVTLRFARDTADPRFQGAVGGLVSELVGAFEPGSLLGFRNVETEGNLVDQPGLLDGAAGVALPLLAAGTTADPAWDRMFLLS
jgi:hypothetical protein